MFTPDNYHIHFNCTGVDLVMQARILYLFSIVLLLINGVGGVYGGWNLIIDPSGSNIGLPIEWLANTKFQNYFVPGLILFIVNGLFSFIVILLILLKNKNYPLFILSEGFILSTFLVIEISLTLIYNSLQLGMACIGILLIVNGYRLSRLETRNSER